MNLIKYPKQYEPWQEFILPDQCPIVAINQLTEGVWGVMGANGDTLLSLQLRTEEVRRIAEIVLTPPPESVP